MSELDELYVEQNAILTDYGKESDIPFNHLYWRNKNKIILIQNNPEPKTVAKRPTTESVPEPVVEPIIEPVALAEEFKIPTKEDDLKFLEGLE